MYVVYMYKFILHLYVYIYIYIYICMYTYIYGNEGQKNAKKEKMDLNPPKVSICIHIFVH
jgi:hypothetical protein